MDKSHIACFLGGAALASAFLWLTQQKGKKSTAVPTKQIDTESEQYQQIKQ